LEILETIKNVTGMAVPYEAAPRREGDLTRLYADASHAKSVLGFEPQHSDLRNIIETAWAFHKDKWNVS
jgi:UDP-glucose 4-epimerase